MNTAIIKIYCTAHARLVHRKNRDAGQGLTEYLGLVLIMGAALALGAYSLSGLSDGPLVEFFQNSVKEGLRKALDNLGIGGNK